MSKSRIVLELLRVLFIFLILLAVLGTLFENMYGAIGNGGEQYSWLLYMAIFLFTFVLYRNKLQFSGWYEGKEKLPKKVSQLLLAVAVILVLLPPFIAQFL